MVEKVDKSKSVEDLGILDIKPATEADIPAVWEIIHEASQWLADQGLGHWSKYYTEEMVAKMVARKKVFLGQTKARPVATVTYDTKPPWYYNEPGYGEKFTNPTDAAVYVTALAVVPTEQKQGFASKMVELVEGNARRDGAKWLRLDCRAEVPGLVTFYERRGFQKLGNEPVDEGEDGTFWLMEKLLLTEK